MADQAHTCSFRTPHASTTAFRLQQLKEYCRKPPAVKRKHFTNRLAKPYRATRVDRTQLTLTLGLMDALSETWSHVPYRTSPCKLRYMDALSETFATRQQQNLATGHSSVIKLRYSRFVESKTSRFERQNCRPAALMDTKIATGCPQLYGSCAALGTLYL